MANKIFGAITLTGGSSGSLDSIRISVLTDADMALVINTSEDAHIYRFESSSTAAESSPQAIRPDDYATAGVWILTDLTMEDLKVYGNAVIDGTLTQTGNANFAGNVDIDGALTFDGAGPAIIAIEDNDSLGTSDVKLCTQGNVKAYTDTAVAGVTVSYDLLAGMIHRPLFEYNDTTSIKIYGFRYHHNGTVEQILKNDTTLTFTFGSGGSNASSDDLTASAWHYLFIDDSALSGTTVTAARLRNDTTAPTWDADQLGWYTGNDRCIGAFLTNGSSQIVTFWHDGGRLIQFDEAYASSLTATSSWVQTTLTLPAFCNSAQVLFYIFRSGNDWANGLWRNGASTGSGIIGVGTTRNTYVNSIYQTQRVITNTDQTIDIKCSDAGNTLTVYTEGFYLPRGL